MGVWHPKKFYLEKKKKKKLLSTWSTFCSGFAGRLLEYIVIYKYEIVHVISFLEYLSVHRDQNRPVNVFSCPMIKILLFRAFLCSKILGFTA